MNKIESLESPLNGLIQEEFEVRLENRDLLAIPDQLHGIGVRAQHAAIVVGSATGPWARTPSVVRKIKKKIFILVSGIRVGLEVEFDVLHAANEAGNALLLVGKKTFGRDDELPVAVSGRAPRQAVEFSSYRGHWE